MYLNIGENKMKKIALLIVSFLFAGCSAMIDDFSSMKEPLVEKIETIATSELGETETAAQEKNPVVSENPEREEVSAEENKKEDVAENPVEETITEEKPAESETSEPETTEDKNLENEKTETETTEEEKTPAEETSVMEFVASIDDELKVYLSGDVYVVSDGEKETRFTKEDVENSGNYLSVSKGFVYILDLKDGSDGKLYFGDMINPAVCLE